MEHSESDSASVPNVSDPLMGPQCAPTESPTSLHDPVPSDLDQTVQDGALCRELQSKLDLKGESEEGGETADKVSNFTDVGDVKDHDEGNGDAGGGGSDDDGVKNDDGVNGVDVVDKSGDFVGVNGDDEGVKVDDEGVNDYDEAVKGDDEGVMDDEEGVKGDDEGVNGYDERVKGVDEGVKDDDGCVKGGDVGVNGGDEGIKGGDEGVKGDDVGVKGADEVVNDYDEEVKGDDEFEVANGYVEGVKGGYDDGDGRGWDVNSWDENVNEVDVNAEYEVGDVYGLEDGDGDGVEKMEERSVGGGRTNQYPWRPEAPDCAYYMKTGTCKYGLNCKFNHPIKRKNQVVMEFAGERDEPPERPDQTECKYYLRSGGCKFGKDCKYNHTRANDSTPPIAELNFLGLPIRPGKRECPYYMRNGSCKFGANCKFNHPDPTTVGGCDPPSGYGNGASISLHGVSKQSVSTWSSPRAINETSPFVPMMFSPNQGVSPQGSDWNGYEAPPAYPSERNMRPRPPAPYVMNNPTIETNAFMQQQKHMLVDEFPERPGEPECSYFLKTGDCKFKSNCKFHHPKSRVAKLPPCNLNDKGLPLRPDKNPCSHYTRYGICKFGPACKYDHPNVLPSLDQQSYTDLASGVMGGNGDASNSTL